MLLLSFLNVFFVFFLFSKPFLIVLLSIPHLLNPPPPLLLLSDDPCPNWLPILCLLHVIPDRQVFQQIGTMTLPHIEVSQMHRSVPLCGISTDVSFIFSP